MKQSKITFVANALLNKFPFILTLWLFLGCGLMNFHYTEHQTAETTGIVLETHFTRALYKRPSRRVVKFKYSVDGKTYESSDSWVEHEPGQYGRKKQNYSIGMRGKVCYEPADPKYSSFYSPNEEIECGQYYTKK